MTFFQMKTYSLLIQLSLGHKRLIFKFNNQKKKKKKKLKGQLRYLFLDLDILSVIKGVLFLSTFFFFICGYLLTTTLTSLVILKPLLSIVLFS